MRRLPGLCVLCLAAGTAVMAQTTGPAATPTHARIHGLVRDSLAAGAPLAAARVQLVDDAGARDVVRSADSDSLGRFAFDGIPAGRYRIGFLHPVLDSFGLEPPQRVVLLRGGASLRVDLGTPAPARLRAAVCPADVTAGTPAFVTGIVRRASDELPLSGATVTGEWLDLAIGRGAIGQRRSRVVDTTGATGWFALCGVPPGGAVVLSARQGDEETGRIEWEVPPTGITRRDLFVGGAGVGGLTGRVETAEDARPIPGAEIAVGGGPRALADASGQWILVSIPTGTRELQVRAVGRIPRSMPVDVIGGAPPIRVALAATDVLLDTVRVTADRARLQGTGFDERRRHAGGRYLTAEDLGRRPLLFISEVFQTMPGLRVHRSGSGEAVLLMRGPFGECAPAVYLDGQHVRIESAYDLDAWVDPERVAGIEVYAGTTVPAEFQAGMSGCGSIVIWTRQSSSPPQRRSLRRRALQGLTALLLGAGVGLLLSR